jgi:hypothetical protein
MAANSDAKTREPTIAAEFDNWLRKVFPDGIDDDQRRNMRGIFYCGAFAAFNLICRLAGDDDEDDALGAARIESLNQEFARYFADLRSDRA